MMRSRPKYINTPDTQLYRKTQVLYGIDLAKAAIVKKRQVVIVEGYTDVMACHLAGVDTAIATCGTAFGAEHAKIVRRLIADDSLGAIQLIGPAEGRGAGPLSSRIVFTFDGDAAGQKAALHAFGLDSAFLSQTFVAVADDNLDPCDLRIERGNEAVRSLIERAKPLYDFVIDAAIGRFDTTFTAGQMGAVKAVAPLIAQIRDRSLHDLYTRKARAAPSAWTWTSCSARSPTNADASTCATRTPTRPNGGTVRPVPSPASRGGSRGAIRTRIRRHARRSNAAMRTSRRITGSTTPCSSANSSSWPR